MPNVLQPSLSNTPTYKQNTDTTGIAPYATDLLQRGQAFTTADAPVYTGQLTTGPSQYQTQAWQGLANLTVPKNITEAGTQLGNISTQQQNLSYDPTKFTAGTFGAAEAQKYMNPYIESALNPQMEYQRRQAAINQQGDMAKLAQAGAFGGSRQAILQGQNQEALGRLQSATAGAGYEKAYNNAMLQYNEDMKRDMEAQKASEESKQYGATYKQTGLSNAASSQQARATAGANEAQYGLQNLTALSAAGATQQEQEQAALDASYKDWLRQTEYPGKQLEQQKNLITAMSGVLPKTENVYGQKQSALQEAAGGVAGIAKLAEQLGVTPEQIKSVFGIKDVKAAVNEVKKKASDPTYGKIGDTKGATAGTDTPEGTHRDADGNLVDDETGARVDEYTTPEGEGMVDDGGYQPDEDVSQPEEDISIDEPVFEIPEDYEGDFGDYARGGLIDLLHKMRSYK
jgi:hypothetical protein